jgi:hypothetical protein
MKKGRHFLSCAKQHLFSGIVVVSNFIKQKTKNMYKSTLIVLTCLIGSALYGQKLTWLPSQSSIGKNANTFIGGWDSQAIMIHEGQSLHVLDKETLKIKKTHSLKGFSEEKGGGYLGILKTENGWTGIGSQCRLMQKKDTDCYNQYSLLGQGGFAEPVNWLTYPRKLEDPSTAYVSGSNLQVSANGKYLLLWSGTKLRVYDASFNEAYSKDVPDIYTIRGGHVSMRASNRVIDDDGNFYMAGVMINEKLKGSDPEKYHPFFLKYDRANDQFSHHSIDVKDGMTLYPEGKKDFVLAKSSSSLEGRNDAQVVFDGKNGLITVAGIYGDSKGGGVFSVQYDFRNDKIIPLQSYPIPADLSDKISAGSFKGKEIKGTVALQDVLAKENGDVMVLLELDNTKIQTGMLMESGTDYSLGSTMDAECLDILYFNIGKNNSITYYGNIPKHQEVGGMEQLSFIPACVGNDVYVVYNSLAKKDDHELVSVKISPDGTTEKKTLAKLDKKKDSILPNKLSWGIGFGFEWTRKLYGDTKPVQISGNEVLVRAIKDKGSSLMKVTF